MSHNGGTRALTDSIGSTVHEYAYSVFGEIISEDGEAVKNPFMFTAREWEPEVQLYYYRARFYDAANGRFISKDPLGLRGDLNLYRYVYNSPNIYIDPLGLMSVDVDDINCIGYATGCNASIAPDDKQSVSSMLQDDLFFNCRPSSPDACTCPGPSSSNPCDIDDRENYEKIVVYMYRIKGQKSKMKDPFCDPFIVNGGWDIHAFQEDSPGWWLYIPQDMPKPAKIKTITNPADYWHPLATKISYCCCRRK